MSPEDILIFEMEQRIKLVNKVCGYMPAEGTEEAKEEEELEERVRQIRAWSPVPTDDLEKTQADIESLRRQMASRGRSLSPDAEMSGEKRRRSERSSSRDVLQRRKSRDRFLMQPPHVERPAVSSLVGPVSRLRRSVSDDHGQQDLNTPTQFAALGHRQGCLPQPAVSGDQEAGMEGLLQLAGDQPRAASSVGRARRSSQ
tara:strand:+ start:2076 stop:2675 length:600 start_codon:yes stop_codon:yes gene_type:complete